MTRFTAVAVTQSCLEVSSGLKVLLIQLFVTCLASICPKILGMLLGGLCGRLLVLCDTAPWPEQEIKHQQAARQIV